MSANFSSREFRDSLGLFATGIAIATTSNNERRAGITINSFASVSLDPPLVLFSVSCTLHSYPVFDRANGFAINIMRNDQKELSSRFACSGIDKWQGIDAKAGLHGGLIIQPSLVSFDCRLHCRHDGGDHTIFIGHVVQVIKEAVHDPLIYFRSDYHELAAQPALTAA